MVSKSFKELIFTGFVSHRRNIDIQNSIFVGDKCVTERFMN